MSWPKFSRLPGLFLALTLAGLTAGCFQPLYGDKSVVGGSSGVGDKLSSVEVIPVKTPNGTRLSRVGVSVRNDLIYQLTGGSGAAPSAYRLNMRLSSTNLQVIVDINTDRPDIQNYGIDATYTLVDLATNKTVVNSTTFARVSYNIPGQQQRFAGDRGLRDAEDRAAKVIAENIRTRLSSYFAAGT
jgi:LPS-assembly lipoprotein